MKGTKRERRDKLRRVLALVLAALLVLGILYTTLAMLSDARAEEAEPTRYEIELAVDMTAGAIAAHQRVSFTNATGAPLRAVWLNVYANTLRRQEAVPVEDADWDDAFPVGFAPGGVDFLSIRVNDEKADWAVSGSYEQFLRVACDVAVGERAEIELDYTLLVTDNNWALGYGDLGWRLNSFYPALCVYDPFAGDFALNGWTAYTDPLMSDEAEYDMTVVLPAGYRLAASGVCEKLREENGAVVWRVRASEARDVALCFAPQRRVSEKNGQSAAGTRVTAMAATASTAQAMVSAVVKALNVLEGWFGLLPVEQLTLAETDLSGDGLSRTGLIELPTRLCALTRRGELEEAIVRLCARQWFGLDVGNSPENEPWLSDALTSYVRLLCYEQWEGEARYLKRLNDQVLPSLQITLPGGLTVDSAASRFQSRYEYELVVVDRGTAVLHDLRSVMGRETLIDCLGAYVARQSGKIASIGQLVDALDETSASRWDEYLVSHLHDIGEYANYRIEWFE